jgi:hypothetical protein
MRQTVGAMEHEQFPSLASKCQVHLQALGGRLAELIPRRFSRLMERSNWPVFALSPGDSSFDSDADDDIAFDDLTVDFLETFQSWFIFESFQDLASGSSIEALMAPVVAQFRLTFDADTAVNRLDKPEWFLDHLQSCLGRLVPFSARYLQPQDLEEAVSARIGRELTALARDKLIANLNAIKDGLLSTASSSSPSSSDSPSSLFGADVYNQLLVHTLERAIHFFGSNCYSDMYDDEDDRADGYEMSSDMQVLLDSSEDLIGIWLRQVPTLAASDYDDAFDQDGFDGGRAEGGDWWRRFMGKVGKWLRLIKDLQGFERLQCQLLDKAVFSGLLGKLVRRLEYDLVPVSVMTPLEASEALTLLKALMDVYDFLGEQGEEVVMLTLASTASFYQLAGYDGSLLPGGVFHRTLQVLQNLRDTLRRRLVEQYCVDPFVLACTSWVNAMAYYAPPDYRDRSRESDHSGGSEDHDGDAHHSDDGDQEDKELSSLHDGLRKGFVLLEPRIRLIERRAEPTDRKAILAMVYGLMEDFFLRRMILRNYFDADGARRFQRHVGLLGRMLPGADFARLTDAIRILQCNDPVVDRRLRSDDVDEAMLAMECLHISTLPLDMCEQVLQSKK